MAGERKPRSDMQRGIAIAFGACIGILLFVVVINVIFFGGILGLGIFGVALVGSALEDAADESAYQSDSLGSSYEPIVPYSDSADKAPDATTTRSPIEARRTETPQPSHYVTSDTLYLLPIKSRTDAAREQAHRLPPGSIITVATIESSHTGTWYMLTGWDESRQQYSGYVHETDLENQELREYDAR